MIEYSKTIAIIGGGFSGVAVAANLVKKAKDPIHIIIIEKSDSIGPGIAFGTLESAHPLNVVTENMGLFADHPQGFYEWLQANDSMWLAADASFAHLNIYQQQYLPRKLYGIYLKDVFAKTLEEARTKHLKLEVIHDEAIGIDQGFTIQTLQGKKIHADIVVLAMSVPTNKHFTFENKELLANPHYIRNLWEMKSSLPPTSEVAILGSGLTTMDALWSLQKSAFRGHIHVISRSGDFPQSHTFSESKNIDYTMQQLPKGGLALFRFWRQELRKLRESEMDWRGLVDALRPHSSNLWMQFDLKSKKQFLRHLFPIWNRHRHRMSPESSGLLEKLKANKLLKVHQGYIVNVSETENEQLCVQFKADKNAEPKHVVVDYVINCTGPEYAFAKRQDPFVRCLIQKGFIEPDDLGLGLKTVHNEKLSGNNRGALFALGSLLFGERFETTSVPDIRVQAASIANEIIS